MTSSIKSHNLDIHDPEDVRAIVAAARRKGLIHGGSNATPAKPAVIEKTGSAVSTPTAAGVRSVWMDVDPGTAAHWLQNNFVNRPINQDVIDAYARDMARGVWIPTHQGVAFNDLDHLIDGQHRLSGIVKSGVTVRMMVTFGLPSVIPGSEMTTMDAVDRGKQRSVADQLRIQHGFKHAPLIAQMTVALGSICYNVRTRRMSVGQTLEIYREFQPAVDWMAGARPKEHGLKMTGVLAAFAFAMSASDEAAHVGTMRGHFIALKTGEGLTPGMPLHHLRDFLLSDDAKLFNRGLDRGVAELVLQTLMLQSAGETIERLEPSPNGLHLFRSLQPARVDKVAKLFLLP
jgi:hypothetical protein